VKDKNNNSIFIYRREEDQSNLSILKKIKGIYIEHNYFHYYCFPFFGWSMSRGLQMLQM
jgi:hypothetical protein